MAKLKGLNGVAFNLADSFTSVTNSEYLYELGYLKAEHVEISLLNGKAVPRKLDTVNLKKALGRYRKWFFFLKYRNWA